MQETFQELEQAEVGKPPRIDLRGRAGPIRIARMKELEIEIQCLLTDISDPKPGYALGARMRLRLILLVRGQTSRRNDLNFTAKSFNDCE